MGLISCTKFDQRKQAKGQEKSKKVESLARSIMENFLHKGASFEDIKNILGEPVRMYKYSDNSPEVYVYNNKVTGYKEWNFAVDKKGSVVWLNYMPWNDSLFDRVEILPKTWKKYHCKKKNKTDASVPHIIREYTFFECAGGRILAYYNVHGEIGTIFIKR